MTEEKKRKPLGLKSVTVTAPSREAQIIQSLSHGRSKTVAVEVKRKRNKEVLEATSDEGPSKFTDQEQTLRRRAVQEDRMAQARKESEALLAPEKDFLGESIDDYADDSAQDIVISEELEKDPLPSIPGKPEQKISAFVPIAESYPVHKKKIKEEKPYEEQKKPFKVARKKHTKLANYQESEHENMEGKPFVGLKKLKKKGALKKTFKKSIIIGDRIKDVELAALLGEKISSLNKRLSRMGIQHATYLDGDIAQIAAEEMGFEVKRSYQENLEMALWGQKSLSLTKRPPVVTVMGHVDHGKTSLLDALRKTNVVAKEAGGITQHIGAYQVHLDENKTITFVDTPGHEAFAQMRARGARATDIVVLVVAADDGVSAQTIEAISHVKAASIPIIVAINKIDKPNARADYVRQSLLTHSIVVEKLGGDVQDVEVSALKGTNLDVLQEAILLQADLMELRADENARAKGVILETCMKKGHGIVATALVQDGNLSKGDIVVAGESFGRVRLLMDAQDQIINKALPSQPVQIIGFSELSLTGERFLAVPSEDIAKKIIQQKQLKKLHIEEKKEEAPLSLHFKNQSVKELAIIIKADTQGSLEALLYELSKIQHEEVFLKIVHKNVGPVNDSDALLAQATSAMIVAFQVNLLPEARRIVQKNFLNVLSKGVIYQIVDDIRSTLSGLLRPIYQEEKLGEALVSQLFSMKKTIIAGCMVKEGTLCRGGMVRIIRNKNVCHESTIKSIRHLKNDVKEISMGYECGIVLDGCNDIVLGDIIECFVKKEIKRSLS
jgi:translation initiation factor IF-2